jgi:hypothetical protein
LDMDLGALTIRTSLLPTFGRQILLISEIDNARNGQMAQMQYTMTRNTYVQGVHSLDSVWEILEGR